jgi:hypothetical protein
MIVSRIQTPEGSFASLELKIMNGGVYSHLKDFELEFFN